MNIKKSSRGWRTEIAFYFYSFSLFFELMKQLCSSPVSSTTKALFILFFSVLLFFCPSAAAVYTIICISHAEIVSAHTHTHAAQQTGRKRGGDV